MSQLAVNTITDASGGTTASINGYTPTASNMAGKNRIINGAMMIDQRNAGAAVTTNSSYPVDRFQMSNTSDGAFSAQQDSSAPAGFVNSLKVTATTADGTLTTTQRLTVRQIIEGNNISDLAWGSASAKTITLSFWVRSSLTGTFGGSLQNGDGNRSYPFTYSISAADTWEQKSVTITGDTSGTWLTTTGRGILVFFGLGAGPDISGTAGAWAGASYVSATGAVSVIGTLNATWYITGVQLEVGSAATEFEHRLYGQELLLCQRYFESSAFPAATFSQGSTTTIPVFVTNTDRANGVKFTVPKRNAPTVTIYSRNNNAGKVSFLSSGADNAGTASVVAISEYGWSNTIIGTATTAGVGVEVGYTASSEL